MGRPCSGPDMERGVVLKLPVDGSEPTTLPFDGGSMPGDPATRALTVRRLCGRFALTAEPAAVLPARPD